MTAAPITSAGRFSPRGPRGMFTFVKKPRCLLLFEPLSIVLGPERAGKGLAPISRYGRNVNHRSRPIFTGLACQRAYYSQHYWTTRQKFKLRHYPDSLEEQTHKRR